MGLRIAVAGNVNADLSYELPRLPRPGETLLASQARLGLGGKAANASVALARLGAAPRLVGSVGADAFGDMVLDALRGAGVGVGEVERRPGMTGLATVLVAPPGQENAIVTSLGANLSMETADVPAFGDCAGLLLTLGLAPSTLLAVVAAARRDGVPVIVDATPLQELPLAPELTAVDLLSANCAETEALTGRRPEPADPAAACRPLHNLGAARVVLKLGEQGAIWSDGRDAGHEPAPAVEAVDPTGAGDAFMAALVFRWLQGGSLAQSTAFACAVGALTATAPGAQARWSTLRDVDRFIADHRR
jgi:ribokinase